MSSSGGHQQSKSRAIPTRTVPISDSSQLPHDYCTTPGGTLFSTTPGGKAGKEAKEKARRLRASRAPHEGKRERERKTRARAGPPERGKRGVRSAWLLKRFVSRRLKKGCVEPLRGLGGGKGPRQKPPQAGGRKKIESEVALWKRDAPSGAHCLPSPGRGGKRRLSLRRWEWGPACSAGEAEPRAAKLPRVFYTRERKRAGIRFLAA